MLMYEQDYKGGLIVEWTNGPLWPYLLKPYFGKLPSASTSVGNTETRDKILKCPMATEKPTDDSDNSPTPSPFQLFFTNHSSFGKVEAAYGMNRYLYDARLKTTTNTRYWLHKDANPNANFFTLQHVSAKKSQPIPLMFDCRWREAYMDNNNETYLGFETNASRLDKGMQLVATKRHNRSVNVAFIDLSVRTVPLPELWSFSWNPIWKPPATLPKVPW
jgi:prepilin-type processing-associated H-X9-DG protein